MIDWTDVLIGVVLWTPVLIFNGWVNVKLYKRRQRLRETKFLRKLRIAYPEATISLIAVESTDDEAMRKIVEQLENHPSMFEG